MLLGQPGSDDFQSPSIHTWCDRSSFSLREKVRMRVGSAGLREKIMLVYHDDCSGTVSYALAGAGLVSVPMSSKEFRAYGSRGPGKWITVYARNGHTFAVIAGLRLDTTSPHNPSRRWAPRWQPTDRMPNGFEARHPIGL